MTTTDGLARGVAVRDTGGPIRVPVGEVTLGRVFDVLGKPIDEKGPVDGDAPRLPIHRPAPQFLNQVLLAARHDQVPPDRPATLGNNAAQADRPLEKDADGPAVGLNSRDGCDR